MKFFTLIVAVSFLVGALALTDEQKAKNKKLSKECQTETGVSDESLQKARRGEEVDDPKLKDQALCFAKKTGAMNDAGEMQLDAIRKKIKSLVQNKDDADKIVEKCTVEKDNPKETAYNFIKCLHDNRSNFMSIAH